MATRSFLNANEIAVAKELLLKEGAHAVSRFIGDKLEQKLAAHKLWRASRPYKLGSWSRGELALKSDIDLLFVGDESLVAELVKDFQSEGIKIRARVPADINDWTKEVESFDVLALLGAVPFFVEDQFVLKQQQDMIRRRGLAYSKKLFQVMLTERKARSERYDSISNYLEPNLKYGPGGLRDLEQGLMIRMLFADKFKNDEDIFSKLKKQKLFLLKYRHFLHLQSASDIFTGGLQAEATALFDYSSIQKFMSELEATLSEVSFCADWIAEVATKSAKARSAVESERVESLSLAFSALKKNSSLIMQYHVRKNVIYPKERKQVGKILEKYFNTSVRDEFIQAIFRSELMAGIISPLKRLKGHVQHDQYHRYSVDAHTLQAVREVIRIKRNSKTIGRLSTVARDLTPFEWEVLLWSALYHDLGKGLKGDHASEGAEIVKQDLVGMGVSLKLTAQVTWLVQNHLLLSGAAFRKNPHDSSTWAELFRRGVKGRRIQKLAVFTALDIRSTNPEAWNDWKERLLFDLCSILQSPKASRLSDFLEFAEKKKIKIEKEFIENLDPHVVESLPREKLLADYQSLVKTNADLPPLVLSNRKKELWIRFHSKKDKPGLFLSFVRQLHGIGLSVQEAFIQTYEEHGAYDWFKVKSDRPILAIKKMLLVARPLELALKPLGKHTEKSPQIKFSVIELVAQDDRLAIISFRGKDQRGALYAAAQAIFSVGLQIQSAKVHTWGRQIDDVFTVAKSKNFSDDFAKLNQLNT